MDHHGIAYNEHLLDDDEERQAFYDRTGTATVPQIYLDGERIGGYTDLATSDIVTRHQAGNFDSAF